MIFRAWAIRSGPRSTEVRTTRQTVNVGMTSSLFGSGWRKYSLRPLSRVGRSCPLQDENPARPNHTNFMACDYNIELSIKRMKSLLHIDKLRTKQHSKLAEVYLYSKIIYQLIVEHDMRTMFGHIWGSLDQERQGTWWRFYKLLKARLDTILIAQWAWKAARGHECFHELMERPRKRKLQCLPRRVVELQQRLNALPHAA